MAVYANLVLDQGSDFSVVIQYLDSAGSSIDLNGYQARSKMRRSYYSANATTLTTYISDANNGNVSLSLNANATANLKIGRYVFDVEIFANTTYTVNRIVEGTILVMPEATKWQYL